MMSGNTQVMLTNCLRSRGVFGLLSRFAFARLTIILVRCGSAFLESSDFAVNVRKHVSVRLILHDVSRQTGFYSVLHLAVSTGTPLGWYKLVEPDIVSVRLDGTQLHLEPGQAVIPHGPDREFTVADALPRGKRA